MDVSKIDDRFQSVFRDHRFKSIKEKQRKIKIDARFQSMFTDDRFKLQYDVDKRGKPVHETSSQNLKKYYRLSNKERKRLKLERKKERDKLNRLLSNDNLVKTDSNELEEENLLEESGDSESSDDYSGSESDSSGPDLARGEGNVESSSDEEEDEDLPHQTDHHWSELDVEAERSEESSRRLALCNMDWERIKAIDLLVLFDSFKLGTGRVEKVTIYPSEYGAKRMAEENELGPVELREDHEDEEDGMEGRKFQVEKLREHQIKRLKYYYAVIDCDCVETADAIYKECDGLEYETSSTKLDLRFIPDEMTFDEHPPKDVADQIPDKDFYKPSNFVTTALNQSKVDLTWDETDHRRLALTTRKFNEDDLANMDMNDYLASSSGEDDEIADENFVNPGLSSKTTDEDQIARYRSLLLGDLDAGDDKPDDVDMEITWEPDLLGDKEVEEDAGDDSEDGSESEEQESIKSSEKVEEDDDRRKAELEMLMMDADDVTKKHFDIHEIIKDQQMSRRKKRKLGREDEEDEFKMNLDDSRFSALYSSSAFALDPNNPAFRKTKGMQELISERHSRLHQSSNDENGSRAVDPPEIKEHDSDLSKLVNAVKMKTKHEFSKKLKSK
ncbi:ESF1 homolog [Clavelina lepadiformis]|uniref:ESF1 homolog n=1 Tax=Clavelina lepadiformis TaxID=159417 RepID=UPI00404225CD